MIITLTKYWILRQCLNESSEGGLEGLQMSRSIIVPNLWGSRGKSKHRS